MSAVLHDELATWQPREDAARSARFVAALEAGQVVCFGHLGFEVLPEERYLLDPRWSDERSKNISYDPQARALRGAEGNLADLEAMAAMIDRYQRHALALVDALLPAYRGQLRAAPASFRPVSVERRGLTWRKDDSLLHVDAFPSRPCHGERILRLFSNVNPRGLERSWRIGEPFDALATRFLPRLRAPLPGMAGLLQTLRVTKSRRSAYDHYMLELHDRMKADAGFQRDSPQEHVDFVPGTTWLCYTDQIAHAAMSGQFLFEQTLHLPVDAMCEPERSPLRVLEGLVGHALA